MPEFVEGRLLPVSCKDARKRPGMDPASPLERAEFYSATGSLHWLSSQYRLDQSFDVNQYQKVQHEATVEHIKELSKSIKDTKENDACLRVVPISGRMAIGCWHDSSLYGSMSELIEDDEESTKSSIAIKSKVKCV